MQRTVHSLRAECMADADALKRLVSAACPISVVTLVADEDGLPDQEIEIRSSLNTEQISGLIRSIPDGHVMLQTLQPTALAENSLERNYERE